MHGYEDLRRWALVNGESVDMTVEYIDVSRSNASEVI
jgi:hypothetical protein